MGYYNEFPHTRGYDGDLGWLIKMYKELLEYFSNIDNILNENLEKILQDFLESGELYVDGVYTSQTQDIKFIFTKE